MAVIRDVMPAFELFQPLSIDDALALQARYGEKGWVLAGGLDSFDWFADRVKRPEVVIDLSQIKELTGVRTVSDGLEIGAMTTLTDVVRHPIVAAEVRRFILPQAAGGGRVPADSQSGNTWRKRFAGCSLLVLPGRLAVLPCRWQHLLRGYAHRSEPRARYS